MKTLYALVLLGLPLTGCRSSVAIESVLVVVNISPPGGSINISLEANVIATFNHPLSDDTVSAEDVSLLDVNGDLVAAEVLHLANTNSIVVEPEVALERSETYTLVLGTGISSADGVALAAEIQSSFSTTGVIAANGLPIADAGEDQDVLVGSTVALDGSGSSDPEDQALTYTWSMETTPIGSASTLDDTSAVGVSFQADSEGTYVVSLVVSDGLDNSNPDYVQVAVTEEGDTGDPPDTNDTGDPPTYDGDYSGPILMEIVENQVLWADDICSGTIDISVDTTASPAVTGVFNCTFTPDGPFTDFWPTMDGVLDGEISGNLVAGTVQVEDVNGPWGGAFASTSSLSGAFNGEVQVDVGGVILQLGYDGNFTVSR